MSSTASACPSSAPALIQAWAWPHPAISRMVLGPRALGTGRALQTSSRPCRVLAVSSSGSHFVAPELMWNGQLGNLLVAVVACLEQQPRDLTCGQDRPPLGRLLLSVEELHNPRHWHLPVHADAGTAPVEGGDTSEADYLARFVDWAFEALSPPLRAVLARQTLPLPLALRVLAAVGLSDSSPNAQHYARQALLTQPLPRLRALVEPTDAAARLFHALSRGLSLNRAERREHPDIASAAQRHALQCARVMPDATASTWHLAMACLPRVPRDLWPVSHTRWRQLFLLLDDARASWLEDEAILDREALVQAVAIAASHHSQGNLEAGVRRRSPWTTCMDGPATDEDGTTVARRILSFRAAARCALSLVKGVPSSDHALDAADTALVDRLVIALSQPTDRPFVGELGTLLSGSPPVTLGSLTVDFVRSENDAGRAGARLDNCLRGSGRVRYSTDLLGGRVLARISTGGQLIGLVTVCVALRGPGPGIMARTGMPLGLRNAALSSETQRQVERFAQALAERVHGLDRYAAVVTALAVCRQAVGRPVGENA